MIRLSFIIVLILIFAFQFFYGQETPVGSVSDIADDNNNVNRDCLGGEPYCSNHAVDSSEESHERIINNPSILSNIFFGPVLIILSLLVLRAFSKRAEE